MINFDTEKNGYSKAQVAEYFEQVKAEYEALYAENQALIAKLQKGGQEVPAERLEAIALALVDAETEAQRIINSARDKAWKILTDAKKGLPEEAGRENYFSDPAPAAPADRQPADGLDQWVAAFLQKNRGGSDG